MRLVAVVRDKTVVTVLDDWMARNNYPGWEEGTISPPPAPSLASPLADKIRSLAIVASSGASPLVDATADSPAPVPAASVAAVETAVTSIEASDIYSLLAAECRALGQRLRALREHRSAVDLEIEAVLKDYDEKRERLLAIMNEGASA